MKTKTAIIIFLITVLTLGCVSETRASTSLTIDTEGFGTITDEITGNTNHNGTMVWTGNAWDINSMAAHAYFVDTHTGARVKLYTDVLDASVSISEAETTTHADGYGEVYPSQSLEFYTITKQVLWYTTNCDPQKQIGSYQYGAVEYRITESETGNTIILVSRGSGSGRTTNAYFDVYIEDIRNDTIKSTTAFINGLWYSIPMDAVSALSQTDISTYRVGSLSGATNQNNMGDFFLDINGGSDMGGLSFELHTTSFSTKFSEISASYITSFELKFTNSQGDLAKIVVKPTLLNEVYNSNANPSPSVPEFSILTILPLLAVIPLMAVAIHKRRYLPEK